MNPYHVLGVSPLANLETLKSAYRRLARENHPDSAQDDEAREAATTRMASINAAWQVVSDPVQRQALDTRLRLEKAENSVRNFRERGIHAPSQHVAPTSPRRRAAASPRSSMSSSGRHERSMGKIRGSRTARGATAATPGPLGVGRARKTSPNTSRVAKLSSQAKLTEASRLFREQGRSDAAMTLCLSVLRTDFRSVPARELLSELYVAQGQPHRAFALLEQALMLEPTNGALVRKLSQLSNHSGRLNPASNHQRSPVSGTESGASTPPGELSPLAMSVKHSVLGRLWAYLLRRTVGGK